MPITQKRMIAVISAGQLWQQAFEFSREHIVQLGMLCEAGKITPQEIAMEIAKTFHSARPSDEQVRALMFEEMHFKIRAKDNERERKRQQRRRDIARGDYSSQGKMLDQENPLEKALRTATLADRIAFERGEAFNPPPAAAQADTIHLAAPENIKHTITQGKKGETIERTVKFSTGDEAEGAPPGAMNFDPSESGSIL
jgi:hypothetical protein